MFGGRSLNPPTRGRSFSITRSRKSSRFLWDRISVISRRPMQIFATEKAGTTYPRPPPLSRRASLPVELDFQMDRIGLLALERRLAEVDAPGNRAGHVR